MDGGEFRARFPREKGPTFFEKTLRAAQKSESLFWYVDTESWMPLWIQLTVLWIRRKLGKL